MQEYQLKEIVGQNKLNYGNLKRVYDYIKENPGQPTSEIASNLGMAKNIYRYRDLLFHHKIINKFNVVIDHTEDRLKLYEWPAPIKDGDNIDKSPMVNLASLLARFSDNDIIPGFDMTRAEVVEAITNYVVKNPHNYKQLLGIAMQTLAVAGIVSNNLSAFTNMTNISPVVKDDLEVFFE